MALSEKQKTKIQKRIDNISSNSCLAENSILLLYDMRDFTTKGGIIREFGDFIHSHRDRGSAFDLVNATARDIRDAFTGELNRFTIKPLATYSSFIDALIAELKNLGFNVSENAIKQNKKKICSALIEELDGKIIKIQVEEFEDCELSKSNAQKMPALLANLKPKKDFGSGSRRLYKKVALAFSLLSSDSESDSKTKKQASKLFSLFKILHISRNPKNK